MEDIITRKVIPFVSAMSSMSLIPRETHFRYFFERSPLGVMVTGADNRIIYVNAAFERQTGYGVGEVLGQTPAVLQSGRHDSEFYRTLWQALITQGYWQGEIWNRNKSGLIYPELLTINKIVDEQTGEVRYLGQFFDITQRKQIEELLNYEASHDLLTGLANKSTMQRHLDRVLKQAGADARSIAVLYIDLDGFKSVNDRRGHLEGDIVLKSFAKKLRASVRESDFVARVGGDEFVIVLDIHDPDRNVAFDVAEKILATMKLPFETDSSRLYVGCSIGISIFPDNGESAHELLGAADKAMYKVKRQGGGYLYHVTKSLDASEANLHKSKSKTGNLNLFKYLGVLKQ